MDGFEIPAYSTPLKSEEGHLYCQGTSWGTPIVANVIASNYDRLLNLAVGGFQSGGKNRVSLNIDFGSYWADFQALLQTLKQQQEDEALKTYIHELVLNRYRLDRDPTFALDEILAVIDEAQGEPQSYADPRLLWLLYTDVSGRSAIIQLIYAVCRLLRRILFVPRAEFRGLSWSKRPWCLLHGSHPPKMPTPVAVVGCA